MPEARTQTRVIRSLSALLTSCLGFTSAHAQDAQPLFDQPIQEQHLRLPPDPLNPHTKPEVACFHYPGLMIKQVDLGEKGAARLAIIPVPPDKKAPPCTRQKARGERVVDSTDWAGYFEGVKAPFVFFTSDDGRNDGQGFAVFTQEGRKIFADLSSGLHRIELLSPPQRPEDRPWHSSLLKLRYERIHLASCSLRAAPEACWQTIRQATGLSASQPPDCSASYEAEEKRVPAGLREQVAADPSVIAYEVEVVLDDGGTVQRVTPVSDARGCWAAQ
ncbi:hypothetical protein [Uliginosibacterium sp. TH139]|uniref:hypothetical protein n=1 Tax=Uliginosibacterium sp. TH139 TaxID=2067453 RepID=UPI000C7E6F0F|nr:hypothetical protein [Uliginosibacterium sp. TH139]PLK50641.1 hypothetical protein C0V76_02165 [Uliginosibacterium sp. TH139]